MRIAAYLVEDNIRDILQKICTSLGWTFHHYVDTTLENFPNIKEYDVFVINEYWTRIVPRQILKYAQAGEIAVVFASKGLLPNTQIFDCRGYGTKAWMHQNANAMIARHMHPLAQKESEILSRRLIDDNVTYYHQPSTADKIDGSFVLLPLQYSRDYSIVECSNLKSADGYKEYVSTVARFCHDHGLNLAIKTHPIIDILTKEKAEQYLLRYPCAGPITDADTNEVISRFSLESKWCADLLDSLTTKYGKMIQCVNGNINVLMRDCLFAVTVNATTCINALIVNKVIATCGSTPFRDSGTVVYNADPYTSMKEALTLATSPNNTFYARQKAFLLAIFKEYLIVEQCYPEFLDLNEKKVLFQMLLACDDVPPIPVENYDVLLEEELRNQSMSDLFAGQASSIISLSMNHARNNMLYYPKGVICNKNIDGYVKVIVKPGDSLWSLFGANWQRVLALEVNRHFRDEFSNPNYIFPHAVLYAPEDVLVSKTSPLNL